MVASPTGHRLRNVKPYRAITANCSAKDLSLPARRHPANSPQFPGGLLWLQKLIRWQPAVRFAPNKIEHPIPEHAKPKRDPVARLGLAGSFLRPEVLSCISEA